MNAKSRFFDPRLRAEPTVETAVWLVQLRWVAVVGQWLAVGITHWGLGIALPIIPLLSLIGVTVVSNLAVTYVIRRYRIAPSIPLEKDIDVASTSSVHVPSSWLGCLLLLDVLTLTGLLYYCGGVENPFSCFYLANIVVGGLILSPIWTWSLAVASVVCTVWLLGFAPSLPAIGTNYAASRTFFSVPKQGLLIALATCCTVITYFITVLVRELRRREKRIAEAEEQRERSQRVEALATLAAGAGHELASPLSTIAVVAKELHRKLEKADADPLIRRDVQLIRSELDRCREVLQRMKSGAGEAAAERMNQVTVDQLVTTILSPLREPDRVETVIEPILRDDAIQLPLQAVSQAIRNLVQNALDASPPTSRIAMHLQKRDEGWLVLIIDQGSGMHDEVLRRIGQPFFTTKDVGQGMGLGVFLTRNVITGLGGTLQFESTSGRGTTCRVTLPRRS